MLKRITIVTLAIATFMLPAFKEAVAQGYSTEAAQNSALGKAGMFADADLNNVGIVIYYGTGNGASAEQAGDWVIEKLNERLGERRATDQKFLPEGIDGAYFVQPLVGSDAREGIVVGFLTGGVGVKKDIREAVTDAILDYVLDGLAASARLLKQ